MKGKDDSTVGEPAVKPIGEGALIVDEVKVLVYACTCDLSHKKHCFLVSYCIKSSFL